MLVGQDIGFLDSLKVSGAGILVVFLELSLLAVFIILLSKTVMFFVNKSEKKSAASLVPDAPIIEDYVTTDHLVSTTSHGELELVETDEPTAAVIMAIISDKTDIPLNRLKFIRIKKLEDDQR
ncbi:MAG TPA: OadG family protein [Clostridia bacterium]|nr:OadG family protein [Clostridia bacterium]